MTEPPPTTGSGLLLKPIQRARSKRSAAEAELRRAIVRAMESRRGIVTVEQIAEAAGVTRARVYQILQEEQR